MTSPFQEAITQNRREIISLLAPSSNDDLDGAPEPLKDAYRLGWNMAKDGVQECPEGFQDNVLGVYWDLGVLDAKQNRPLRWPMPDVDWSDGF